MKIGRFFLAVPQLGHGVLASLCCGTEPPRVILDLLRAYNNGIQPRKFLLYDVKLPTAGYGIHFMFIVLSHGTNPWEWVMGYS